MKEGRSEVEFPYVFIPTLTISHCYNLLIYLALVYVWLATSGLLPMKSIVCPYKKAVLPQGNRAMPQVFFSVEVRQQHSLQV